MRLARHAYWTLPVALLAAACGRTNPLDFDPNGLGAGGAAASGGTAASGGVSGGGVGGAGFGGDSGAGFGGDAGGGVGGDAGGGVGGVGGIGGSGGCDADMDGFEGPQCLGVDCNDMNPSVFPGAPEVCTDGADNDCNGVTDCFDPACAGAPICGCVPVPEACSNGVDDDCDTIVDCFDSDCVGTPACGCSPFETCDDGIDNDCDGFIDCDDSECGSDQSCLCMGADELCANGSDDDCDLLVDCADPDCQGTAECACIPPGQPEQCVDGSDNDCDLLADCADPDCLMHPACVNCTTEVCSDGLDNDCDGQIDCADQSCFLDPACPVGPEICNNGLDDDFDGLTDCSDPDCATNPFCVVQQGNCLSPTLIPGSGSYFGDTTGDENDYEGVCGGAAGEAVFFFVLNQPARVHLDTNGTSFDSTLHVRKGSCESGTEIGCDDDSGGVNRSASLDFVLLSTGTYFVFVDGFTVDPFLGPDEGPFQLNVEIEANPPELCSDGQDNDGDQYADCADPDCLFAPGCFNCNGGNPPSAEFGVAACTDGQDNDCDGTVDCADKDCSASDYYVTECCNGIDQNGNGTPDDFNCRCASDADCIPGHICYTHTAFACGPPCGQFVGDVCPFVAGGSTCSAQTNQCEF